MFLRTRRASVNAQTDDIPALAGNTFTVNKTSVGGIHDVQCAKHTKFGVGGLIIRYMRPEDQKVS